MKKNIKAINSGMFIWICLVCFNLLTIKALAVDKTELQPTAIFSNTAPITINTAPATGVPRNNSVYPSTINISGMSGTVTRVAVSLRGLGTPYTSSSAFLLVSPTGAKYLFLSGISLVSADSVYTFADDGSDYFMTNLPGVYKPIINNTVTNVFPVPAPPAPYSQPPNATFASVFNGTDPNGTWSLYALGYGGGINSGWSLTITTNGTPQTFANSNYMEFPAPVRSTPYGTSINVSGLSGVISNIKATINGYSHTQNSDVDVLLVNPNGQGVILMSDGGGSASNINLTFDDTGTQNSSPTVSGSYKPFDSLGSSSNLTDDVFLAPAPYRPYFITGRNTMSKFNGFTPNGTWTLYVVDDSGNTHSGSIVGGWSLEITTQPLALPPVGCATASFASTNFAVGTNPTGLTAGDFNGDGKLDLATANQVSNDVSILLGNGNGTFAAQSILNAGSSPYAIVSGNFNGDSNLDLAVANSGSNNVSILYGNGNGTFAAPVNFTVGANPISLAVGDLNNDSRQDLVVANFGGFIFGQVTILLNSASGFVAPVNLRTRTQPSFVKIADLNGDGNQDLIVANFGSDSISTFFGNGSGTLQLSQNLNTGAGPVAVEIIDNNGDNFVDIAVANYNNDSLSLFTNNGGSGIFTSVGFDESIGINPISLVYGDFLGAGGSNLAVALSGSNKVRVRSFSQFDTGALPNAIVKGDFNGDGKLDLATANSGSNNVTILQNACGIARGNIFDFNGDRRTDFAVFRSLNGVWFNQAFGSNFSNPYKLFGRDTDKIVPADYDGDLLTDYAIYRPENGLWIVQKDNDVYAGATHFILFGLPEDVPVPGDYDGDRKAEIAVWRPSNGTYYIRRSSDNSFSAFQFGANGDKPVIADFDGDTKADYAVFRPSNGTWYFIKSSNGQFGAVQFGISTDKLVPSDYDADGKTDIAVYRNGTWYYLKSLDGSFKVFNFGLATDIPIPGDYDADGSTDLAVFRPSERIWYILRSSDNGFQTVQYGLGIDTPVPSAFVR